MQVCSGMDQVKENLRVRCMSCNVWVPLDRVVQGDEPDISACLFCSEGCMRDWKETLRGRTPAA